MIYVMTIIMVLVASAPEASSGPTILSQSFDTRYDCDMAIGEAAHEADTDPMVTGWWIDPHSCELISVPDKT